MGTRSCDDGAALVADRRGITIIAIVAGGAIGAVAALVGAHRPDPPPLSTSTSEPGWPTGSEPARPPSAEPPVGPTPSAAPTPSPSAEPGLELGTTRNELDALTVTELERGCGRRAPRACLAAGRAYDLGRGVAGDAGKSRLYRALAVSLFDEQCMARDAEACHSLATLYEAGQGVTRSDATATLLRARATEICAGRATDFCDRLRAGTAPLP